MISDSKTKTSFTYSNLLSPTLSCGHLQKVLPVQIYLGLPFPHSSPRKPLLSLFQNVVETLKTHGAQREFATGNAGCIIPVLAKHPHLYSYIKSTEGAR